MYRARNARGRFRKTRTGRARNVRGRFAKMTRKNRSTMRKNRKSTRKNRKD